MKKLLCALLAFAALISITAAPVRAQAPMTFLSYYSSQTDALNALINRALDQPPYTKGHSYTNSSDAALSLIFATAESKVGYYCWTFVMSKASNNAAGITIVYSLGGVTLRTVTLYPGGTIADFVACDVIVISKTASDVVQYGGFYNR